jgi:hypothetical protein
MSWIKRNLYFLLGSLVTVGLLAVAILYLVQKYSAMTHVLSDLEQAYSELKRLYSLNPNPGNPKIDNIEIAQEQQQELRTFLRKAGERFARIPSIPDSANVTTEEFTAQLRRTIDQLQRDAAQSSVTLPPKYDFTFYAIKPKVTFATNSLRVLSVQLGEIKAICDILFHANINALDSLRREPVCPEDDPEKSPADYLSLKSVTNDLAILTPYEITFRCFSSGLAGVIGGFASSPNAFVVKTIGIEPAVAATGAETVPYPPTEALPTAQPVLPAPVGPLRRPPAPQMSSFEAYYRARRGVRAAEKPAAPTPPPTTAVVTPTAGAATGKGGLPTVINEKVFKVSLRIDVVKLTLPKQKGA